MSYDLAAWKRSRAAPAASPTDVYEAICDDQTHPALTRCDVPAFTADVRAVFGDPNADEDADDAVLYDACDFTGAPPNWVLFTLGCGQVESVPPELVRIAGTHGLTVYDPQRQAILVG